MYIYRYICILYMRIYIYSARVLSLQPLLCLDCRSDLTSRKWSDTEKSYEICLESPWRTTSREEPEICRIKLMVQTSDLLFFPTTFWSLGSLSTCWCGPNPNLHQDLHQHKEFVGPLWIWPIQILYIDLKCTPSKLSRLKDVVDLSTPLDCWFLLATSEWC